MTRYDKQFFELDFTYFYKEKEHKTLVAVGIKTRDAHVPLSYECMCQTFVIYSQSSIKEFTQTNLFQWRKGEFPKDKGKEFFEMLTERRNKALEKSL